MAEDTLITALEDDARSQASRIIEEANEAAAALLKEASLEAERERAERVSALELKTKREKAALHNAARMKTSGNILAVRHEFIDRAMNEAEKRFANQQKDDYSKLLQQLFTELKKEWEKERPGEIPVVFVNPSDKGLLQTEFPVREDRDVRLGVVFTSEDGTVRFENTIPARMSKGRTVMEQAINEMLFDEVFP